MSSSSESVTERIDRVVAEFADLAPRERLETLLEFAENLPTLPEEYRRERDAGVNRVHECQTPVFLWVEVEDARLRIFADVAPEAPTVKGFVAILVEVFDRAPLDEALAADSNLIAKLGLAETLGMMRARGLHAIQHFIRARIRLAAQ